MRFKPRTELERIVDALNHYNYNKKNTEIVKKQIKKMDFNTVKKLKIQNLNKLNYSLYTSSDSESSYSDEEGPGKIGQYRNKIIKKKEIKDKKKDTHFDKIKAANLSMRELMSDYHHKTHFKGAKQLVDSLHKTKLLSKSSSNFFSQSTKSFKLSRNSNLRQKTPKIVLETTQQINKSILSNFSGKFPINQENFDIIQNNPLLYNLKIGERNRNESKVDSYEDKINYLKNLINQSPSYSINKYSNLVKKLSTRAKTKNQFGNLFKFDQETEEEENSAKILEEGDKVLIDDEMIPISNIELIANKMLKKCNVIHSKSSSNGGQLKKGTGKLMITSGMTLNDFKQKYKI